MEVHRRSNNDIICVCIIYDLLMKKTLIALAILLAFFFIGQRVLAHFYLPEENSTKVVIYTTTWCPYCEALRGTLNSYQIPFTEYDTESSLHGFIGFFALGGTGVPIAVIGNQILYGYDGQEVTDALVQAGYEIPAIW